MAKLTEEQKYKYQQGIKALIGAIILALCAISGLLYIYLISAVNIN
jgi:hypothetical protein